jgi:enterochelin esterase-like enzyme
VIVGRRAAVSLAGALALGSVARRARGEEALGPPVRDLAVRDVTMPPWHGTPRRYVLLLPTHLGPNEHVPLLVLLHGLAETVDPKMGAYAWLERYGVGTAYDRLRRAPIERTSRRGDWTDARLAEVNGDLATRPFRGMALVCPFVPNVYKSPNPTAEMDALAGWIVDEVVPACQVDAPINPDPARTGLDGCSLGGFIGLEVFLRRPEAFATWGGVQSAISEAGAAGYADRLEKAVGRVGARMLHVESSSLDPYRAANERLAAELARRKLPCELRVPPGPHDQPWLREAGTIEMLAWHDRALRG